jgi:hypothetical protein
MAAKVIEQRLDDVEESLAPGLDLGFGRAG